MPTGSDVYKALPANYLKPKTGSKTAAEWNSFTYAYAPFVFPTLWWINSLNTSKAVRTGRNASMTAEELHCVMLLVQITHLAIRPVISSIQNSELRDNIAQYIPLALRLHPGMKNTRNLHQMTHIPQDIELHGPVYCHWAFKMERLNKKLGDVNTNGKPGERERTALKARYRSTQIGLLHCQLETMASTDAEKSFAANLQNLLEDSLPSDLQGNSKYSATIRSIREDKEDLRNREVGKGIVLRFGQPESLSATELYMIKDALRTSKGTRNVMVHIHDESVNSRSSHPGSWRIFPAAVRFKEVKFQHTRFRGFPGRDNLRQRSLMEFRDCIFAIKPISDILTCRNSEPIKVCAILDVFTHRLSKDGSGQSEERIFAVISDLIRAEADDFLEYRLW